MKLLRPFRFLALLPLLLAACGAPEDGDPPIAARESAVSFRTLQPGGRIEIRQELTVNVVFIGYEPGNGPRRVNQRDFLAQLPRTYQGRVRAPSGYGINQPSGQRFDYRYALHYADRRFEDAFFGRLSELATPAPRTLFQDAYNDQDIRSLTIGQNHTIDAPSVERWLAHNAGPRLGVDTSRYTIFFINWHGRRDFKFHVYTKTNEPDPDTGYNFGQERASRKIIAWGGTPADDPQGGPLGVRRLWFYDLSAGPESWTANYDLVTADLDNNGATDYRMPPVWEYGNRAGYRPFVDLSGDLGKIARYVAIDLLFTTSPLYDPALPSPRLPGSVQVDMNVYQGEPGFDGKTQVQRRLLVDKLQALRPRNRLGLELVDQAFTGEARRVYQCWLSGTSCYGDRLGGVAFADLFLYHGDNLSRFLEGDAAYEAPVFAYNTTDALDNGGLLGYADDNWADGTQSFVFAFDSPGTRAAGYGFTTTTIHEVGHHIGMSHPHDGYDAEADLDFGPGDDTFFAWSGDESNSIMSYIDLNWDFSQFDRDNMNRYMTSTYLNHANTILGRIVAHPRSGLVAPLLRQADTFAAQAIADYQRMDYPQGLARAQAAYELIVLAARVLPVPIDTATARRVASLRGAPNRSAIDPIDDHRGAP